MWPIFLLHPIPRTIAKFLKPFWRPSMKRLEGNHFKGQGPLKKRHISQVPSTGILSRKQFSYVKSCLCTCSFPYHKYMFNIWKKLSEGTKIIVPYIMVLNIKRFEKEMKLFLAAMYLPSGNKAQISLLSFCYCCSGICKQNMFFIFWAALYLFILFEK